MTLLPVRAGRTALSAAVGRGEASSRKSAKNTAAGMRRKFSVKEGSE